MARLLKSKTSSSEQVQVIPVGPLPVIKALMDELDVIGIINALVPNPTGEYGYGDVAGVVIASRLQREPLPIYEIEEWAAEGAVPVVFGIPADKLNDDRIGEMLDAVRPHRVEIWSRVINQAVRRYGVELKELHADPTKIAFEGSYEAGETPLPEVPQPAYGKPKDGRADRKLLTLSNWVSADGGVPVWFEVWDGDQADDPTYLNDLRALRAHLPLPGVVVISGDCKLPSKGNIAQMCRWEYHFVATEPWRAAQEERLEKLLRQGAEWQTLDYFAESDRKKPLSQRSQYACIPEITDIKETTSGQTYRVRRLFIRSSRKAEQAQAKRERQLAVIRAELTHMQSLMNKYDYTSQERVQARVKKALGRNPSGRYFHVQVKEKAPGDLQLTWHLKRKSLEAEAQWDGVYSVLTNLPEVTHSPSAVLEIYKNQHHVEGRFRDLNQLPVRVRPVWLHRPDRIETMIFLIMVAVLLFALLERQVRRTIAQTGQKIRGLMPEQRDTTRPKGARLLKAFNILSVVKLSDGQHSRLLLSELSSVQRQIIQALDLADLSTYLAGLTQTSSPSFAVLEN
jgi:transposase